MHIVLTDLLTCPSCGDGHGLIARADRMAGRHIEQGALGCPDCRRQFPIRDGVAHLVANGSAAITGPSPAGAGPAAARDDEPVRIAALLGLDRATGFVLLAGPAARHAAAVAALAEGVEVVAAGAESGGASAERVSRVVFGRPLPFSPGRLRAIWLGAGFADALLESAVRALHPTARLVLEPAPADTESRLPAEFRIMARQDRTVVCARAG